MHLSRSRGGGDGWAHADKADFCTHHNVVVRAPAQHELLSIYDLCRLDTAASQSARSTMCTCEGSRENFAIATDAPSAPSA